MWGVGIFVCRQWWRQYRTHLHILVPHPLLPAQLHNHYILTTMLCTQYQILHNSAFLIYFFILLYAVFISWYASLCCVYILICFFMQCLYLDMPLYAVFISWYASLWVSYFFYSWIYVECAWGGIISTHRHPPNQKRRQFFTFRILCIL